MKLGKRTFIALIAASLSLPAFAQDPKPVPKPEELGFDPNRLDRITRAFQGYIDSGELPGAVVLIARNGKTAYFQAFGYRDRERKARMTTDTIFRIASMTKPIASVAAMILVEEGKLDLAAPVSRYLPEFKDLQVGVPTKDAATGKTELVLQPQKRPMIVQDLLRHTAGLVYAPPLGSGPVSQLYREAGVSTRDEPLSTMVTKLSKLPLAHQPGEVWEYSVATDILGRVVEVVSGTDLDRFIEDRITKPLGMTSTGFVVPEANKDRIAEPQANPATGQRPPLFDPLKKPARIAGGGGGVSTAGDYLRLCEIFLNGGKGDEVRLLAPSTVALMTANALRPGTGYSAEAQRSVDSAPTPAMGQGFGLGFSIRIEAGQNPLPASVGSYYWGGAYGTSFHIDPKEKLVIIMMLQMGSGASAPYRHAIRNLAYQALVTPMQ